MTRPRRPSPHRAATEPPRSRCGRLISGLLLAGLAAGPAAAHPHVFIEGGADLGFDPEGRLAELHVTWIYDQLTSLFMVEELGLPSDPDPALDAADRAPLAAYQTEWQPDFEGDSYLFDGKRAVELSGPVAPDAEIRDGKVIITFTRKVVEPFRPTADTRVEIYDPTYYTAYTITETPELIGAAEGCRAELVPYQPTAELAALQTSLFAIPADEDPEENLGGLFADKILVSCD